MGRISEISKTAVNETLDNIIKNLNELSAEMRFGECEHKQADGVDKAIDKIKMFYSEVN